METKRIIIGDSNIVPMLFTVIEKTLKREIGTHVYVDKRFVDELRRMSDNEERNGSILFFDDWREGYHYYESYFDCKGILEHVEVYDEKMQDIKEPQFKATFVENSVNYCQLVSFSSAKVREYYHYEVMLKDFLIINYIA